MNDDKQEIISMIISVPMYPSIGLLLLGIFLIPLQGISYLYSGNWFLFTVCSISTDCKFLFGWESWIGLSKILRFTFEQHPLISGIIILPFSLVLTLLVFVIGIRLNQFYVKCLNKIKESKS